MIVTFGNILQSEPTSYKYFGNKPHGSMFKFNDTF